MVRGARPTCRLSEPMPPRSPTCAQKFFFARGCLTGPVWHSYHLRQVSKLLTYSGKGLQPHRNTGLAQKKKKEEERRCATVGTAVRPWSRSHTPRAPFQRASEVPQAPLTARLSAPLGDPRPPYVTWLRCDRRSTFETTHGRHALALRWPSPRGDQRSLRLAEDHPGEVLTCPVQCAPRRSRGQRSPRGRRTRTTGRHGHANLGHGRWADRDVWV